VHFNCRIALILKYYNLTKEKEMSEEKFRNNHKTRYESLCDLNLLMWSQSGSEWSSIIREECLVDPNQLVEEEEPNFINKTIFLGVLATLALLSAAAWTRSPEISQALQQVGTNSVEQLILSNY